MKNDLNIVILISQIVSEGIDFDWGVVVNIRKKANQTDKVKV